MLAIPGTARRMANLNITPATAVALGAGALGLGYGASQLMNDGEASGEELSRLYLQNKMNQALLDRAVGSGLVSGRQ